ncbi:possible restriction endonuclease [Prevotella intermedia]|uniref:Possible restriction endonuclease n=1 Tax=Prevotella intermedia TaxID=28131 RepID=A0AAD1F870_PREIN|nr:HNH endonuclease [Prevotella intermedia]AFJ07482.1 HNH endonuclease [Prevotella intermedia 17]APW35424.1 restriction endonuclease [Prevotella intermedia]BAR97008.1 possible restriction endonuclease [Prevotella intermedia]
MASIKKWSREEMILALNLYLKIPFGKMHSRNSAIIDLAKLIGRSSNSVALRLVNYAACDPILHSRGIKGMSGGRQRCLPYWNEFINDRDKLIFESEQILAKYENVSIESKYKDILFDIPTELKGETRLQEVKTRINQSVFRELVLANYNRKCAITGIDIPELLVASHIVPWAENHKERLNPGNGICLSMLWDKAFDRGLISIMPDYTIVFSEHIRNCSDKEFYKSNFANIEGTKIHLPNKYLPNQEFLEWHYNNIFLH